MGHVRLSDLALLSTERETLEHINIEHVFDQFAAIKAIEARSEVAIGSEYFFVYLNAFTGCLFRDSLLILLRAIHS